MTEFELKVIGRELDALPEGEMLCLKVVDANLHFSRMNIDAVNNAIDMAQSYIKEHNIPLVFPPDYA